MKRRLGGAVGGRRAQLANDCRVGRKVRVDMLTAAAYAPMRTRFPAPFFPLCSLWQDVEVIMAKHSLYGICFKELISVTGATDPYLG